MDGSKLRHDLRTPINQILGYSEMLAEDAEASGQAAVLEDLKKIQAAARNLLPLVDRIPDTLDEQGVSGQVEASARAFATPEAAPPTPAATERRGPVGDRRSPGPASDSAPAGRPAANAATLLVVDDNEMNRDMLSRRLRGRGFTVLTAEDGQKALDLIEAHSFDLILLDIMMPVLSGLDVLKILRQTYSVAELPIIMATAKDQGEDIVEALNLGANDYVTKPLDFPVVMARTETQLSLKRAMEEIRRLAQELELRNRFIQKTFGRYRSAEVVRALLETPEGLALGGEKREVTLLMSDLRGFTAMADRYTPEQVVGMLNNYLGTMAEIITRYQGTIDEFIGDAILALFGAPVAREDDAERAAACAVAMQLAMAEVNAWNRREGLPEVQMGIAVNTGDVVVGNIGSQTRAKYGVVGTHVNLAGRIESFTVGGQILVSESTLRKAAANLKVGQRVTFQAKGFAGPVAVYDLLGVSGRHHLFLPERHDELRPLAPAIPITISVLEGKQMTDEAFPGTLVKASMSAAEVHSPRALAPFSNLRVRLDGPDGTQVAGDLYAKVTPAHDDGTGTYVIRFTSADPAVTRALQKALGPTTV